jgi:hypothetical protein
MKLPLKSKLLLVTLASKEPINGGWIVIAKASLRNIAGRKYIDGFHVRYARDNYAQGKRVLISLDHATSITGYESPVEIWPGLAKRKKKRRR